MRAKVNPPPAKRKRKAESAVERVAHACDALRAGKPVLVTGDAALAVYAVETAPEEVVAKAKSARLLLTHARARTLKVRLYTQDIAALAIAPGTRLAQLRAIADPTADLDFPLKGPFETVREALPETAAAAVKLCKLAGLLPAAIALKGRVSGAVTIAAEDILTYDDEIVRTLKIVARARVPLEGAKNAEMVAFRSGDGAAEHYAIVIGAPSTAKPVLTRLHSECFTGDLLGSLKCDCGTQLRGAISAIEKTGGGVLLYLAQEGRGIGLINKLRAYRLQDQGFDTIEANERLGFEADERRFGIAAKMLTLLGYKRVRLMTNNPDKLSALEAHGIEVTARVRHSFPTNPHNRAYLETKVRKAGHLL
jgi:GTP cyclohydrolase II